MSWLDTPLVGFDTETTGVDTGQDRIVSAAVVRDVAGRTSTRTWLVDPGIPIPRGATAIHGITDAQVQAHGQAPAEALEEMAGALADALGRGEPVVAFNAGFDLAILESELARYSLRGLAERLGGPIRPVVDPLVLDRAVDRWRKGKRTLTDLVRVYGVRCDGPLHAADEDVTATLRLLRAIAERHPKLAELDPADLHDWQAEAHRQWAAGMNAFLVSRGRRGDVELTWPLRETSAV